MSTLARMMGATKPLFTSSYDRLDGNIPEDHGAYFGHRNFNLGGRHPWLANRIVDADWRVESLSDLKGACPRTC